MNKNTHKAITYHPHLDEAYEAWAKQCGRDPQSLRRASELAIRTRHHQAFFEHEVHRARGKQPHIFTLSLGSVDMYYTIESDAVVIRGYGWEIDHEPYDDYDGGGFYTEFDW